ncbi:sugar lactone lactonase YvrE [Inhella inkyongensis]|uniref:Sugar lactone lactonase YvrE n=1 Tax=Inhella inkyongensis TaxID=392593 RepID=A0A840S2D0_9BURK|nr:gluconolaconase [Inhella inkyongensis]MBB5203682.1 sugar lactone lactonase YvrE [Inhella inkyongensis]
MLAASPLWAQPLGRLQLLAGDGHPGWRDGAAYQARFSDPFGLAVAADGSLWVSDGGDTNRIRRIAPDGRVGSVLGSGREGFRDGAPTEAQLHTPSGLAFDGQQQLLIADTGNQRIRRLERDGQLRTLAGDGQVGWRDGPAAQARFDGPMAVVADAQGRVYVADTYNHRIRVIEQGRVRTLAGAGQPGEADGVGERASFDHPLGLALDATAGLLYVADARNHAIRRIHLASAEVQTLAKSDPRDEEAMLRRPIALALDREGRLLVTTLARGRLLRCATPRGVCTDWEELSGPPEARLARPSGLAVDAQSRILVADAASYRVHRWVPGSVGGPMGPAQDRNLPDTQGRWPLDPQLRAHEVVGTIGEVRARRRSPAVDRHHLHAGLDVQADPGRLVRAIASAKVSSPLAAWSFGELGEGLSLGELAYIHMKVGRKAGNASLDPQRFVVRKDARGRADHLLVRRGTRFKAGEVLGTVNAMAHVHLELGPSAYARDPLQLGFAGFSDRQMPRIEALELLDETGRALRPNSQGLVPWDGRPLRVVVEAWDQVDGNLPRRRLGVQRLSWQLLNAAGQPLPGFEAPQLRQDYRSLPQDAEPTPIAFAPGSGIQVQGAQHTRMRYEISNRVRDGRALMERLEGHRLAPGRYRLRVLVQDAAGNSASASVDLLR